MTPQEAGKNTKVAVNQHLWCRTLNLCYIQYRKSCNYGLWKKDSNRSYLIEVYTSGSAIAEGPRDVLVSRNSATTKYRYRVALFA